ncbi:MAG: HlyD family efflux transporter periplasmic adaptor subunit [Bacillota bacterium]
MSVTIKKTTGKKTVRKRKRTGLRFVFYLVLIGIVVYFAYEPLEGLIARKFAEVYEAEIGVVERELLVPNALLVRDETLLFAPESGVLIILAPEGKRVAEKELLARIQTPQGQLKEVIAVRSGIVCYHLDGLEGVVDSAETPFSGIAAERLVAFELKENKQGTQLIKGQPLLKLVNNLKSMYLRIKFDSMYLEDFPPEGKRVIFRVGGQEFSAIVKEILSQGVNVFAVLELNKGEFLHERELDVNLVLKTAKGIKIPNTALIETGEDKAVYKVFATGHRLTPVRILLQNQEYAIVEGLSRGDRIVRYPDKIKGF